MILRLETDEQIGCSIKKIASDAGIRANLIFHPLRQAYATHLLERGLSLRQVLHLPGHKSIETTLIRTKLTEPAEQNAFVLTKHHNRSSTNLTRCEGILVNTLAEALDRCAVPFYKTDGNQLSDGDRRDLSAIRRCRTEHYSKITILCTGCENIDVKY